MVTRILLIFLCLGILHTVNGCYVDPSPYGNRPAYRQQESEHEEQEQRRRRAREREREEERERERYQYYHEGEPRGDR